MDGHPGEEGVVVSNGEARKRGLPLKVKMRHDTHFVEALTSRHETPVGRMVPLSAVEPDPDQPRKLMGELDDLVRSIQDKGVLEPILVRPLEEGGAAAFRIISGERRFRASLEAGLFEIPVIVLDVSEEEALEIALIENLQRKDLTPFEEADGYLALADRYGYTHEQISDAVGKSRTVVTESLALLAMPVKVREAVHALGVGSKSVLLEVLKAETPEEMLRLLEQVSSRGLNRDDLRRRMRSTKPGDGRRRRKPYVFKFKSPDKTYALSLSFRQQEVDRGDLIRALEETLEQLRAEAR